MYTGKNTQAYLPPRRNTSPDKCKIGSLCWEQWAACPIKPLRPEEDLWVKKADHGYKIKVNSITICSTYYISNDCVLLYWAFLTRAFSLPLREMKSLHWWRPSDRVRKTVENYVEILGNIMRKKVTIMQKRRQIMWEFVKLTKLFPWLFPMYKIHINVLPRISVLYFMFDLLLPFMGRYFFVQRTFHKFVRSLVTRH